MLESQDVGHPKAEALPLVLRLENRLWAQRADDRLERVGLRVARYLFALSRDFAEGEMSLRAMSLVYTSLLSLVPLLALAFSILKALGAKDTLQPLLAQFLEPLGSQGQALAANISSFVDKMQVGVLGSIGVATLLYTTVSTIQKVESSFNFLWGVHKMRGLAESFGKYITMILVGPIILFTVIGMTATVSSSDLVTELRSIQPFGFAIVIATALVPYVLMIATFSMLYAFIPNTRVGWGSALTGGAVAGIAWQASSAGFARFVSGASNYNAIYSGFAIVIFLLLWLYLSWLIVLAGCRLAFYVEYPASLRRVAPLKPPGSRESEWAVMTIMTAIGQRFLNGEPPLTLDRLAPAFGIPSDRIDQAISLLQSDGLLAGLGPEGELLPTRDLQRISLHELWLVARGEAPKWAKNAPEAAKIAVFLNAKENENRDEAQPGNLRQWLIG